MRRGSYEVLEELIAELRHEVEQLKSAREADRESLREAITRLEAQDKVQRADVESLKQRVAALEAKQPYQWTLLPHQPVNDPCIDSRGHDYPTVWNGVVPPKCTRCGKPSSTLTWTVPTVTAPQPLYNISTISHDGSGLFVSGAKPSTTLTFSNEGANR